MGADDRGSMQPLDAPIPIRRTLSNWISLRRAAEVAVQVLAVSAHPFICKPGVQRKATKRRQFALGCLRVGLVGAALGGVGVCRSGGEHNHNTTAKPAVAPSFARPSLTASGCRPSPAPWQGRRRLCRPRPRHTVFDDASARITAPPALAAAQQQLNDDANGKQSLVNVSATGQEPLADSAASQGAAVAASDSMQSLGSRKQEQKKSDAFFTDRFPTLQKIKPLIMPVFFAFSFYKGWIGRFGFLAGLMSKSYFDMLAVPLRVVPDTIGTGKSLVVCQFYVDSVVRLIGYLINVGRGKAKFPPDVKSLMPSLPPGLVGPTASPAATPTSAVPASTMVRPSTQTLPRRKFFIAMACGGALAVVAFVTGFTR